MSGAPPRCAQIFCSTDATMSGYARSQEKATSLPPISFPRPVSAAMSRATRTSSAPALPSARAHSEPIPRDAPVTTAERPDSGVSLPAVVLDIVVDRLPQDETRELRGSQHGLENAPECDDDVLRGGNPVAEKVDLDIQVAVVDLVDDVLLNHVLHVREVDHVAGEIGRASCRERV